jgi:hypothetical protein
LHLRSWPKDAHFFGAPFNELGALRNIQAAILSPLSCACFLTGSRKRLSWVTESLMPIVKNSPYQIAIFRLRKGVQICAPFEPLLPGMA